MAFQRKGFSKSYLRFQKRNMARVFLLLLVFLSLACLRSTASDSSDDELGGRFTEEDVPSDPDDAASCEADGAAAEEAHEDGCSAEQPARRKKKQKGRVWPCSSAQKAFIINQRKKFDRSTEFV